MNIAFPALIALLLILPGILLSYYYKKGFFRRSPISLGPVREEIISGLFWALVLNSIGIAVVECIPGRDVNFEAVLALFAGWPPVSNPRVESYIDAVSKYPASILLYLLLINLSGALLGLASHFVIRKGKFDLRYDYLRFGNEWYYIFSGEARVFEVPQRKRDRSSIKRFLKKELDLVYVSAVVMHGEEALLYWGILSD